MDTPPRKSSLIHLLHWRHILTAEGRVHLQFMVSFGMALLLLLASGAMFVRGLFADELALMGGALLPALVALALLVHGLAVDEAQRKRLGWPR